MKKLQNIIFLALVGGALLFSSCREDEELGFSNSDLNSSVGLTIDGADEGVMAFEIDGSYDSTGALKLTGDITRTYVFALNKACLSEVRLKVEPFSVNIPEERIVISATELVIPVGDRAASVTVGLTQNEAGEEDTSFIADELAAMDYELGVRLVNMDSKNAVFEGGNEAKVTVSKVAYESNLTVEGNKDLSFIRSFSTDKILDEDDISWTFNVRLSRPAHEDITFNFEIEGLADQFKNTLTMAPAEVTIPAGETSTGYVTVTLTDDFLETTTDPEKHNLVFKVIPICSDPTLVIDEESTTFNIRIEKIRNVLKILSGPKATWTAYSPAGWGAYKNEIGGADASAVYDGNPWTDTSFSTDMVLITDMLEERDIAGLRYYYYYGDYYGAYAPGHTTVEISNDGQNWETIGMVEGQYGNLCLEILGGAKARYTRVTGKKVQYTMWAAEFYVYYE